MYCKRFDQISSQCEFQKKRFAVERLLYYNVLYQWVLAARARTRLFRIIKMPNGALRASRPSQLRCFLFTPQNFPSGPNLGRQGCVYLSAKSRFSLHLNFPLMSYRLGRILFVLVSIMESLVQDISVRLASISQRFGLTWFALFQSYLKLDSLRSCHVQDEFFNSSISQGLRLAWFVFASILLRTELCFLIALVCIEANYVRFASILPSSGETQ